MSLVIKKSLLIYPIILSLSFAQSYDNESAHGLGDYNIPFFKADSYHPNVQPPDEFLGFTLGSRPVHHNEVIDYYNYLDKLLDNTALTQYGYTYEGKPLVYLMISSKKNMANIDNIKKSISMLADPRTLDDAKTANKIIKQTPAIAWMAYAIHGDEISSTDAAIQLAYQLAAGTDPATKNILKNLVVSIDPNENPDGRERYLQQLLQWRGEIVNSDANSLDHSGFWPYGRGNHYLFDLNRDWFATVHPETKGKVSAILDWNPQFLVDSHEMGSMDTYLFNPPRAPYNPYMPQTIFKWWDKIAKDQAAAFDEYGWSYYTGDWNEEVYPGYGSSWGIYIGLVGILYEQAGADGSIVKKEDGTITTYRETVHHQFISSMANLQTIANQKEELLQDYYNNRKKAVSTKNAGKAFVFSSKSNRTRLNELGETIKRQTIEVYTNKNDLRLPKAINSSGETVTRQNIPAGSLIIPLNQPLNILIKNILSFDIRLDTKSMEKERKKLLKNQGSTLYDVTAWSLSHAYGTDSYYTEVMPKIAMDIFQPVQNQGNLIGKNPKYGWAIKSDDDQFYHLVGRLLENKVKAWCAKESFNIEGEYFPRGSIVIRNNSNKSMKLGLLKKLAAKYGIDIFAINTALATDGPDLGSSNFTMLIEPKIAIVSGPPTSTYSFGATWHLIDYNLKSRASLINIMNFGWQDLNKYNVMLLPNGRSMKRMLGDSGIKKLKSWVDNGGTLISYSNSAAFLADSSVNISSVKLRRQVLDKLDSYDNDLSKLKEAESFSIDSVALWEGGNIYALDEVKKTNKNNDKIKELDQLGRKFRPQGAILKVNMDQEHWLTVGCGESIPVLYNTGNVLMAKKPVNVAGRLADEKNIRLGGLLWPEAKTRIAETAWVTQEYHGKGQIILFATEPHFRGYFKASERVLLNAIYLGPGMGTSHSVEW
ncbi:MAG: M14 metallopeptidase family protein [Candidatus Neomarinimicrobiota bacterium]